MEGKVEKYLPIGTIVLLKGGTKKLMVCGYCSTSKDTGAKIWDYCGCIYPEGLLSSTQICVFDHEQIEKIEYYGLQDDEQKEFNEKIKNLVNME